MDATDQISGRTTHTILQMLEVWIFLAFLRLVNSGLKTFENNYLFMPEYHKPRNTSSITKNDSKVVIVGKVIDSKENSFVVEDSSGRIEVFSEKKVEKNKLVRIFCSMIEGKLKADIVQEMEGLDLNLFKRIQELYYRRG